MFTARKWVVGLVLLALVLSTVVGCAPKAKEKETVKLSFIGPLTGPHAAMGIGGRNSFMLAVKQRNEDPDTKYHYEVEAIDDECKPDMGVQAALKACGDPKIMASASHYCSMVAITTADTFHNCGLSSTVWGAVLPDITYGNDYIEVCRANGTMVQQNQVHAQWAWDQGFRNICIMHDVTDYGRGHLKYFSEAWEALGGEILSVDGVLIDQADFTAELTNIKALDPDMIYFGGLTDRGVAIKSQFEKLEMKCQFDGTSGIKNEAFNDALGEDAEGVISWLEGAPMEKLPGGAKFLEAYEKEGYEQPPEAYGPFAYVAGNLIVDAIEEVGPDRKKIAERIDKTKKADTIIGPVEFDDHGQNIVALVTCYVSQDGKWVVWEDSEYASGKRTLPGLQ